MRSRACTPSDPPRARTGSHEPAPPLLAHDCWLAQRDHGTCGGPPCGAPLVPRRVSCLCEHRRSSKPIRHRPRPAQRGFGSSHAGQEMCAPPPPPRTAGAADACPPSAQCLPPLRAWRVRCRPMFVRLTSGPCALTCATRSWATWTGTCFPPPPSAHCYLLIPPPWLWPQRHLGPGAVPSGGGQGVGHGPRYIDDGAGEAPEGVGACDAVQALSSAAGDTRIAFSLSWRAARSPLARKRTRWLRGRRVLEAGVGGLRTWRACPRRRPRPRSTARRRWTTRAAPGRTHPRSCAPRTARTRPSSPSVSSTRTLGTRRACTASSSSRGMATSSSAAVWTARSRFGMCTTTGAACARTWATALRCVRCPSGAHAPPPLSSSCPAGRPTPSHRLPQQLR